MNPVSIELVKTLNSLIKRYNNREEGINYVDIRNFEFYIKNQGIDIVEVNKFINS